MKKFFRKIISGFLSLLPSNAPMFIYTVLLKPAPLRKSVNFFLKFLLPKSIVLTEGILFLNQQDPVVSGALALDVYEKYESKLFRETVAEGMTVVDIGANIGYYVVISGKRVGKNGKVVAYEPEDVNFSFLEKNVKRNDFRNVLCRKEAISSEKGEMDFFLSEGNKGMHSLVNEKGTKEKITVSVNTLDSSLSDLGIKKVDIIKMDIEGAEPLALLGMKETLSRERPILFIEFSPTQILCSKKDPAKFLYDIALLGYTLFEISEEEKNIKVIKDFEEFTRRFANADANLYCVKS